MPRSTWLNILIILLVIIAASYVAQLMFEFLSGFSDIILILLLSWLVAYALSPLVDALNDRPLPRQIPQAVARIIDELNQRPLPRQLLQAVGADRTSDFSKQLIKFRVSRPLAVLLVYLGVAIVVLIIIAAIIPAFLSQINAVVPQLTQGDLLEATLSNMLSGILERFNIGTNVRDLLDTVTTSLQSYATPILQNTVAILTSVLSLLGNAFLVILLSFFFALDGPRFSKMLFDAMPERLHQETRMFLMTTDRAFGGFLRSQLVQAAAIGLGTTLVLAIFGIQTALVSGLFAGLFMLIPLLGPPLSLLPPLLSVLLADPSKTLFVIVPLIILQVAIVNIAMPRIMGDALGLHPLVIIVSLLLGIKIAGFWGAFFAMPLAGIISAFGAFLIRRRQRLTELTAAIVQQDENENAPPLDTASIIEESLEPPAPTMPVHKESRA